MRTLRRHLHRKTLAIRTLIAALGVAIAAQPVVPALVVSTAASSALTPRLLWAQAFEQAAEEGQAFGERLLVGPSTDGNRIFFDGVAGVESINIDELFQAGGSEDDRGAMEAAFGSEAAAQFFIGDATGRLATEDSAQGEAYRTIRDTARARAHPDLINDPALRRSAGILDGDDPVFDTFFTECEEVAVAGDGESVHVPEYAYCDRVDLSAAEGDFSFAGEVCFSDPNGVERCISGEARNECEALERRPECALVESQCIEGARGDSGTCYAFSETWDCGYDLDVPGGGTRTMSCGGPIRCMGEECVSRAQEANPDFVQAAATLTGIQYMAMDMACPGNDPASCEVFAGEAMECKRALGGFVDCCETPQGVSLADYLQLSLASYDLAKKIRLGERLEGAGLDVAGAWSAIEDFGSATFSTITKPFTSAWGSLTQSHGGATLEAIESFSLEELKATMVSAVGEFVASAFGAEIAALFFDPVLDAGGEIVGYTLNSAVGTALSVIMWAYTIYTIINVLAQIIWECEEEEFILGARRELQSCHRVGSYCADDTIFGCIERRDAYCCYNSPFARIVQQSARPQLGLGFGAPMAPTCDGFTVAELARLDWDQIDLEEWYGILAANGVIPNTRSEFETEFSLENATHNEWSVLPAPHGGERVQERIDAAGMDAARDKVRRDLWNGIN